MSKRSKIIETVLEKTHREYIDDADKDNVKEDSEKCKKLVGFSNEMELNFAQFLSNCGKHIWIRQVLIPGITDDEEDLIELKKFINTLNNVDKIELLPYHTMGKYKWDRLGYKYELENIRDATEDDIKKAKKIMGIK